MTTSLWGDDFIIPETKKEAKKIISKITKPEETIVKDTSKQLKSKTISLDEKLQIIKDKVYATLGVYIDNTVVIRTKQDYNLQENNLLSVLI